MPPLLLLLALLARRAAAQAAYSEAVLAPRLLANIDALMQEPLAPVQLSLEASAMEFLDLSSDVAVRQWLYQQVLATHTGDVAWAEAAHGGSPTMSMLYVVPRPACPLLLGHLLLLVVPHVMFRRILRILCRALARPLAARPLLQYDRDDAQGLEDGRFIGYFSETSFTYRAAGASAPGALSWTPFSLATINDDCATDACKGEAGKTVSAACGTGLARDTRCVLAGGADDSSATTEGACSGFWWTGCTTTGCCDSSIRNYYSTSKADRGVPGDFTRWRVCECPSAPSRAPSSMASDLAPDLTCAPVAVHRRRSCPTLVPPGNQLFRR